MTAKILICTLCLILPAAWINSSPAQQPPPPVLQEKASDHVLFELLFRIVGGSRGSNLQLTTMLSYQRKAQLADSEVQTLADIGADFVRKVSILDEKAKALTTYGRERGIKPPAELKTLQEERIQLVNQAVKQLSESLDGASFARLYGAVTKQSPSSSAYSTRIPEELARPAPPGSGVRRGDFETPANTSLYESKLPIKYMITPVAADGKTEKRLYKTGDPVLLKVTLLNAADRTVKIHIKEAMASLILLAERDGERLFPRSRELAFMPARSLPDQVELTYSFPLVVGTIRITVDGEVMPAGEYKCSLKRPLSFPPPQDEEEAARIARLAQLSLGSNTIVFKVIE